MNNGDIKEVDGKKYKVVVMDNDDLIRRVIKTLEIEEMCNGCAGVKDE